MQLSSFFHMPPRRSDELEDRAGEGRLSKKLCKIAHDLKGPLSAIGVLKTKLESQNAVATSLLSKVEQALNSIVKELEEERKKELKDSSVHLTIQSDRTGDAVAQNLSESLDEVFNVHNADEAQVVIIDDEPIYQMILRDLFIEKGLKTSQIQSFFDWSEYKKFACSPTILISDLHLGEESGLEQLTSCLNVPFRALVTNELIDSKTKRDCELRGICIFEKTNL